MSKLDWSKAPAGAEWWAYGTWWKAGEGKKEFSYHVEYGWCLSSSQFSSKLANNYEPRPTEWPETDERINNIGLNRTEDDMGHYNELREAQSDLINKPKHYQLIGDLEAIDVIERTLTSEQFKGYLIGNFLKYRLRAGNKDNALQDLAKSEWYRQRAAK